VGVYGIPKKKYDFVSANKAMEGILQRHGGRKLFYAHPFYSRESFYEEMYNGCDYATVRTKYGSHILPEIFNKVVTKENKL
jgi:hypothetical protein